MTPTFEGGARTTGWQARAACLNRDDADRWFSHADRDIEEAVAVCHGQCEVRTECLAFALKTRQDAGVWGGMTEEQRWSMRRTDQRIRRTG